MIRHYRRVRQAVIIALAAGTAFQGCLLSSDGAPALRFREGFTEGLSDGVVSALEGDEPLRDIFSQFAASFVQAFSALITPRSLSGFGSNQGAPSLNGT